MSVNEKNSFLFGAKTFRDKGFDKELTFKPKINKNTDRLVKSRSIRKSREASANNSVAPVPLSSNFLSPRAVSELGDSLQSS